MTIYLPDDLADMVKQYDDLNVSAVCQGALRQELQRRAELSKLDEGMKRVEVYIDQLGADAAFVGKEVYTNDDSGPERSVYITQRHRIAVYDEAAEALYQFDSFEELAGDPAWRDSERDAPLIAAVAEAMGEKHVIELDI